MKVQLTSDMDANSFKNYSLIQQCPICFKSYDRVDPTTFPCGHTCCLDDAKKFHSCPICHKALPSNLSTNYVLKECVQSMKLLEEYLCVNCDMPIESLHKLAKSGLSAAQYALGKRLMHENESGTEALSYLKEAARQDNPLACIELHHLIADNKISCSSDDHRLYLEVAADYGHVECQYELAQLYEEDNNKDLAFKYYGLAADRGHLLSQIKMTTKPDIKGLDLLRYLRFAADQGHEATQILVANYYMEHDTALSLHYFKLATDQGNILACRIVSAHYFIGVPGTPVDIDKAALYLEKVIDHSTSIECKHIAQSYIYDTRKAFKWHRFAADKGDIDSQYYIACCYYDGIVISMNKQKAFQYFKSSATQGHHEARVKLKKLFKVNVK